MPVPFTDLGRDHAPLRAELVAVFERVLDGGAFVLGPEVEEFERQFAQWLGVSDVVTVHSGTTALIAAFAALGVGHGDEVVTVANTFAATVGAVVAVGATPVVIDVDPATLLLDTTQLDRAMNGRTKVVVPVHLYGQVANMEEICDIANRHGAVVVEDAAQAHGATWHGRKAGALGRAACFSFYPGKNLGALGEAGAVATSDKALAQRLRRYRNHGGIAKYEHLEPGINGRLSSLQAGLLSVKLRYLDEWNACRRRCAARYLAGLTDLPLTLPSVVAPEAHVFHLFVIRTPLRDQLASHLRQRGIATGIHYPTAVHELPAFASRVMQACPTPVAEQAAREVLSLPMFGTMTDAEVDEVIAGVRSFFRGR